MTGAKQPQEIGDAAVTPMRRPASPLAVLRALWSVNLAEELQYRGNFVASILGTMFWLVMALLVLAVFFRQAETLGGWRFWEVVVLLGVFNTLAGVVDTLLRPGIGNLAEQIRNGHLDLVLSRPVETQFFVSFRKLAVWRLTDVVMGLALVGYALVKLETTPSVLQLAAFVVTLLAAAVVVYSLWVALMSLAFWFVRVENLSVLFDAVFAAARYPVTVYPGALRFVLVYLLPIAWTTTIPASTLTGRLGAGGVVLSVVVAVISLALSRLVWRTALARYTSAGG
jgi:ABC-2 type transport system permease protein